MVRPNEGISAAPHADATETSEAHDPGLAGEEYAGVLRAMSRAASDVGILATGAKLLCPRGIYKQLRRAEINIRNAAALLRDYGHRAEDA